MEFLPAARRRQCPADRLGKLEIDAATDDLAYMMAMLWYPDRRRAMEGPLLDLYYAALLDEWSGRL